MTHHHGGPAFPVAAQIRNRLSDEEVVTWPEAGMTLRDYFAGQAIVGLLYHTEAAMDATKAAAWAYKAADAMLAERQK